MAKSSLLKKDGDARADTKRKFVAGHEDRVPDDVDTSAQATDMVNEHVEGVGVVTTNTNQLVRVDLDQLLGEAEAAAKDVHTELAGIRSRAKKSGQVSSYAARKLRDLMRVLNSVHERVQIEAVAKPDDPDRSAFKPNEDHLRR